MQLNAKGEGVGPTRPVRVAIVSPHFAPHIGGVEEYALRLAQACLAAPGLEVIVITSNDDGWRGASGRYEGLPVYRLGHWLRVSQTPVSPLWFHQIRRILHRHAIDVVNVHSPVPYMADVAAVAAGARPVIVTYHAGSMRKGAKRADMLIGAYEGHVLPRLFDRAETLVAASSRVLDTALRPWPGKSVVITPGVDVDRFVPASSDGEGSPTLLYVGRLEHTSRWKGVDVLLEAFALLAAEWPDARLELVGGGDAIEHYRQQAEALGVASRTILRGSLRDAALVEAYQRASMVILPSTTDAESFGMALIEAMACGKPVIGSRVGGIPSVIDEGGDGLLVAPGDAVGLAAACQTLLADPVLCGRLGRNGRQKVVSRYRWSEQLDRHLELFRQAADRAPLTGPAEELDWC